MFVHLFIYEISDPTALVIIGKVPVNDPVYLIGPQAPRKTKPQKPDLFDH